MPKSPTATKNCDFGVHRTSIGVAPSIQPASGRNHLRERRIEIYPPRGHLDVNSFSVCTGDQPYLAESVAEKRHGRGSSTAGMSRDPADELRNRIHSAPPIGRFGGTGPSERQHESNSPHSCPGHLRTKTGFCGLGPEPFWSCGIELQIQRNKTSLQAPTLETTTKCELGRGVSRL